MLSDPFRFAEQEFDELFELPNPGLKLPEIYGVDCPRPHVFCDGTVLFPFGSNLRMLQCHDRLPLSDATRSTTF
jgi:hypothetical protein